MFDAFGVISGGVPGINYGHPHYRFLIKKIIPGNNFPPNQTISRLISETTTNKTQKLTKKKAVELQF